MTFCLDPRSWHSARIVGGGDIVLDRPGVLGIRGRDRQLAAGEVLFRERDRSDSVFECTSGRLKLVVAGGHGHEMLLDLVLPGDVFGEQAVLDGLGRDATAVASVASTVFEVSGSDYAAAVARSGDMARQSLRRMSRVLRHATARICADETEFLTERMAHLLVELANRFAGDDFVAGPVTVPITQQELANWLGATRESIARALRQLRADGLVRTERGRFTVLDIDLLKSAPVAGSGTVR